MVQIYVDQISPRIDYVFEFIFGSRGLTYSLSLDDSQEIDLYYSQKKEFSSRVEMSSIMISQQLDHIKPKVDRFFEVECFSFNGIIDPIASIFYVLSRYEEYLSDERDEYQRFPLSASRTPNAWHSKAMCDRWAEAVIKHVGTEYQPKHEGNIIPSFDIDNTYAYRLKSGKRKFLSIVKDAVRLNFSRLQERRSVLSGKSNDPYDTFDKIKSIHARFPETKVFWLIGKWGKKDRNISIENTDHRALIQTLTKEGIDIGLHPSFDSFRKKATISKEKEKLELVCEKEISASRQHFLRFQIPQTYSDLNSVGFTHEYSMGFAEKAGFRSGTARAHPWFDLTANKSTTLIVHPFVYMDGTLLEYMKLSPSESKVLIRELYDEVERYGGDFIFIWHNETIGDYGKWDGWSEVLDFTLSLKHESK